VRPYVILGTGMEDEYNSFMIKKNPLLPTLIVLVVGLACNLTSPKPTLVFPTSRPTVAPTGTSVALTQLAGEPVGKIAYVCQLDKLHNQICLMNTDGSDQHVLVDWPMVQSYYPSFAPDGQSVIFASNISGEFALYEASRDGEVTAIPTVDQEVASPAISPDGKWIAFTIVSDAAANVLALAPRGGGAVTILQSNDSWDPTWSPDGRQILFAGSDEGIIHLYIMNRDGTNVRQVTDRTGLRGRNDWSVGDLLATYIGSAGNHTRNIYTFGTHGESMQMITDGGDNVAPSFSPDGRWITFMSYRDHFWEEFGCEIYIMRTDGTDVRRLTFNDTCDWQPRWGR
jgi:TolB protein